MVKRFLAWDKQRKFGCEFGDFILLGILTLIINTICLLRTNSPWKWMVVFLTTIICVGLCNRRIPD